jgi:hypothetical protein
MPIKIRDFENLLQSKFGFNLSGTRSKDHRWYELQIPGLPIIATKVSHGMKEFSNNLEAIIAKQLRVRRNFFREMFACSKNSDDYQKKVTEDPYPPFNHGFH